MVLELDEVTYARGWMRMCVEFRDKIIFFKRGECETPRKSNFLENGKNGNFGQNLEFF